MPLASGIVKYVHEGVEHLGAFEVEGYFLTLTSPEGRLRAAVGLLDPKKLARKLLKVLVIRAAEAAIDLRVPPPAAIEAAETLKRRTMSASAVL